MKRTLVPLALMVPRLVYRGWVLAVLWTWHVAPLGVPRLSLAGGVGIMAVGMAILPAMVPSAEDNARPDRDVFLWSVVWTTLVLGVGAIAHYAA